MLNEFEMRDKLAEKRKNIKTIKELAAYIKKVEKNCNYDYGVAPRAIAQAALATAWYLADKMGITGFQAGFVMWDFLLGWQFTDNKCGLKVVDYDNMLYPQYDHKFEKYIPAYVWEHLQAEAKNKLEKNAKEEMEHHGWVAHPCVVEHWQSIVDGVVPFGYKVKD